MSYKSLQRIASTLSIIGLGSGILAALAPWVFGARSPAPASFVMPLISGVVLVAIHWLTFRKIQVGSGTRAGLLLPNVALLAIILLGFLYFPSNPASDGSGAAGGVLLVAFFLLPLASNVIYLLFQGRTAGSQPSSS